MSRLFTRRKFVLATKTPNAAQLGAGGNISVVNNISPPTAPVISAAASGSSLITITLVTPATSGAGIARYELERSLTGVGGWTVLSTSATFPYDDSGLTGSTQYFYRARAVDNNTNVSGYSAVVNATTSVAGDWQLEDGHFMPAKQAMILIFPRPNAETSSNARHRWAYYDGVNPVEYRIPIGVSFGAPPFHYELVSGPAGMTVGQVYGEADYGYVTWNPSGSVSNAAVHVRVTDQEGAQISVQWTISTSSSTARFIFVSPSGNNSNSGAIGAPKQTIANVFGSTYAASANPGAICYLRAGTYTVPFYTDNSLNSNPFFDIHTANKPSALVGFPGESVVINHSGASGSMAAGFNGDDLFVQNITANGAPSLSNVRLWQIAAAPRVTFDNFHWTNAGQGTGGTSNATMFFGSADGVVDYLLIKECSETGRASGGGANNYGFCSLYDRRYVLIEDCTFIGGAHTTFYIKGTNQDVTCRYNWIEASNGADIASEGFAPRGVSQRIEWCYNYIKANNGESWHALESGVTDLWSYRNTRYGHVLRFQSGSSNGEYSFENDVIVTDQSTPVGGGSQVSNTGTECQGGTNDGIVNPTTLALTGSFRTTYLGRRGAEIE